MDWVISWTIESMDTICRNGILIRGSRKSKINLWNSHLIEHNKYAGNSLEGIYWFRNKNLRFWKSLRNLSKITWENKTCKSLDFLCQLPRRTLRNEISQTDIPASWELLQVGFRIKGAKSASFRALEKAWTEERWQRELLKGAEEDAKKD